LEHKLKQLEAIDKLKRNSVRQDEYKIIPEQPFVPYFSERDHMGRLNGYNPDKDPDVFRRRNFSEIKSKINALTT